MTEKLDLVCQHASKDRGAATAGRVANQERQRIERSEVIQSGQVLAQVRHARAIQNFFDLNKDSKPCACNGGD